MLKLIDCNSYVCTLKYVEQPLEKLCREIYPKKQKTNDQMADLSPNVSTVNVT